jgi:hypothetical protein
MFLPMPKHQTPYLDRSSSVNNLLPTGETISGVHGNRAHSVVSDVLGNLKHQANVVVSNLQAAENGRELSIESNIDDGTNDLTITITISSENEAIACRTKSFRDSLG